MRIRKVPISSHLPRAGEAKERLEKMRRNFSGPTFSRVVDFFLAHGESERAIVNALFNMLSTEKKMECGDDSKVFQTDEILGLFFCEHENDEDYENSRRCPEQQKCLHYQGTVKSLDTLYQLILSVKPHDRATFGTQVQRFLVLLADDPVNTHTILCGFGDVYEDPEGEMASRKYILSHMRAVCDLYEGLPEDERHMVHGEMLLSMSSPSGA